MGDKRIMDSPSMSSRSIPMRRMVQNSDRREEEPEGHRLIEPEGENRSEDTEGCWSKFWNGNTLVDEEDDDKKPADRIWVWDGWKRKRFVEQK
jgi:hypothetical protein